MYCNELGYEEGESWSAVLKVPIVVGQGMGKRRVLISDAVDRESSL